MPIDAEPLDQIGLHRTRPLCRQGLVMSGGSGDVGMAIDLEFRLGQPGRGQRLAQLAKLAARRFRQQGRIDLEANVQVNGPRSPAFPI